MSTTRITIENLEAATDTAHIEKAIESVPRVSAVEIDPGAKQAIVTHDGAEPERLKRAVAELGYAATVA